MKHDESLLSPYKYQYFKSCPYCLETELLVVGRKGTGDVFHKQVVKCANCNLYFVNPIADPESMKLYYAGYGDQYPRTVEISAKTIEMTKGIIKNFSLNPPNRFLDIGSASGDFVKTFEENGWEAHGVELSESFVKFSREVRQLKNIESKDILELDYPENYFDFILMWHVIEHLRFPIETLRNIFKWLKPGGVLNMGMPHNTIFGNIQSKISGYYSLGDGHTFSFPKKNN